MQKLVKFSENDVNNLRGYMQKNNRNNISFVDNCPIVYKENIEYNVCNIVLSKGALYFHCINATDCLNNDFIPMTDLSSDKGLNQIYKAISLTETISELSDEERNLSEKIFDKFVSFLELNNNEIISTENLVNIPTINGYFSITKVVYVDDTIKFYDKNSSVWACINQLCLKDQILLYKIFKKVIEEQFYDLEYHPMLGSC